MLFIRDAFVATNKGRKSQHSELTEKFSIYQSFLKKDKFTLLADLKNKAVPGVDVATFISARRHAFAMWVGEDTNVDDREPQNAPEQDNDSEDEFDFDQFYPQFA